MNNTPSAKAEAKGIGKRVDLDTAGAGASLLCALHCAIMPFLVTLFPLVGVSFLAQEWTEWMLISISALLGIWSLCMGHREHRHKRALAILSFGLALVVLGRIAEEREMEGVGVPFVVLGGFTIASAHLLNRKLCRSCRLCQNDSEKPTI